MVLKPKSNPSRNLNCSKIGTIRLALIRFIIILKCWTKDKMTFSFPRKPLVTLYKILMKSFVWVHSFLTLLIFHWSTVVITSTWLSQPSYFPDDLIYTIEPRKMLALRLKFPKRILSEMYETQLHHCALVYATHN